MAEIRIGTSGWHYKHWLNDFYPAGLPSEKMFSWYARHFNTVEINNTFYRLPSEEALIRWREMAPADFIFSVKASRFITHMKRLTDPGSSTEKFFSKVATLHETLGPILFQLPPRWQVNVQRLEEFLEALPSAHQYVFEFRDASWATRAVYQLLERFNAGLCLHDWQGVEWPEKLTADIAYVRFHGLTGGYSGSYSPEHLLRWAKRIQRWNSLRQIWIYFNNDIGGHAIHNAKTLRSVLSQTAPNARIVA